MLVVVELGWFGFGFDMGVIIGISDGWGFVFDGVLEGLEESKEGEVDVWDVGG